MISVEADDDAAPKVARRLSDLAGMLAFAGLILYVLLWVGYVRFYAPFGLSPADLGLGYVELLAQAAVGAIVLVTPAAVAAAIPVGHFVVMGNANRGPPPLRWTRGD